MKKINLKPVIMSVTAAIAFGTITVGTTFALFTDKAETKISVKSGKVDVKMTADNLKLYSAEYDETGSVLDENDFKYLLKEQTGTFKNGGTATLDGTSLTISNLTPGDKIVFDLAVDNESNVAIQYRYKYSSTDESRDLLLGMEASVKKYDSATDAYVDFIDLNSTYAYQSDWHLIEPEADLDKLQVELMLPLTAGNQFQDLAAEMNFAIEAVQGNAHVEGVESYDRTLVQNGFIYNEVGEDLVLEGSTMNFDGRTLNVPNGVTIVGDSAFINEKFTSVVLPSTVKEIADYAFYSDTSNLATGAMETVVLNEGLEKIGYRSFKGQPMHSISFPSTLVDLGNGAFQSCSNLESVIIPSGITELNGTFNACIGLSEVRLNDGLKTIGKDALRGTALEVIDIPSSVTSIGEFAFRDCYNLEIVRINSSELEIANNAFTMAAGGKETVTFYVKDRTLFEQLTGVTDSAVNEFTMSSAWKGLPAGRAHFVYKSDLGEHAAITSNESLADAVASAIPGDVIELPAGTYTLPANTNPEITIKGEDPQITIINVDGVTKNTQTTYNIEGATIVSTSGTGIIDGTLQGGTLRNVIIDSRNNDNSSNGIRNTYPQGKLVIEDSFIYGETYGIHADGGVGEIVVRNSTIYGWNSFGKTLKSVTFEGCEFHTSNYGTVRFYQPGYIRNCTFADDFQWIDIAEDGVTVTIENSTGYEGKVFLNSDSFTDAKFIVDGVELSGVESH